MYSEKEVLEFVKEEDVKFIKLAFSDVFGRQKNVSILETELPRAFKHGVAIDASAVAGFGDEYKSDLFLRPDPSTLSILPWRPEHGRVVRMFCNIFHPDGTPFACDSRKILKDAETYAEKRGLKFSFGPEPEFYLFKVGDDGNPTSIPYDNAGYMDIAPEDKGENIRREICLTLEQMEVFPESSHHEEGAGQNEIDFKHDSPLAAADNLTSFYQAVKTVASRNGLYADFSPKPIDGAAGSGLHINFSVKHKNGSPVLLSAVSGVLSKINDITVFLNADEKSYQRLGAFKAPSYVSWSKENRSALMRLPAISGGIERAELRSPDNMLNPYLAFALIIYAATDGITANAEICPPSDFNIYTASKKTLDGMTKLPASLSDAQKLASKSEFVKKYLPAEIISAYAKK